ncbi:nuclear transport factor 2 family protein [Gordonia McavH-238-E]|uniref:nuclear transport factor 2 family protein n=1 Tax=Gordonia sp. McavH-238-E TaxID=2917736 RepID=UPI001EF4DE94|nr:nuclear transport factor 2 family protein [Gordonia sp. McavH-238-E]MCG7630902.1 nuclear transport factor 2 family protein [Gordonia sp. McavH-238-E]
MAADEQVGAIKQLEFRYWRASDAKDVTAFRDCFVRSGARIDYGPMGTYDDANALTDIFRRVALHKKDGRFAILDMHHGMHPAITLTSETTAVGRWSLRFRQVNLLDRTETVMVGEYDDEYVVEDGEWKIAASTLIERWRMRQPLAPEVEITEGTFAASLED